MLGKSPFSLGNLTCEIDEFIFQTYKNYLEIFYGNEDIDDAAGFGGNGQVDFSPLTKAENIDLNILFTYRHNGCKQPMYNIRI